MVPEREKLPRSRFCCSQAPCFPRSRSKVQLGNEGWGCLPALAPLSFPSCTWERLGSEAVLSGPGARRATLLPRRVRLSVFVRDRDIVDRGKVEIRPDRGRPILEDDFQVPMLGGSFGMKSDADALILAHHVLAHNVVAPFFRRGRPNINLIENLSGAVVQGEIQIPFRGEAAGHAQE